MSGRQNPFLMLNDPPSFTTKPREQKPVEKEAIDDIAARHNFPSREAAPRTAKVERRKQRRYRTGRDHPVGIKATAETRERFYKMADERNVPLGELLRLALDALEGLGEGA